MEIGRKERLYRAEFGETVNANSKWMTHLKMRDCRRGGCQKAADGLLLIEGKGTLTMVVVFSYSFGWLGSKPVRPFQGKIGGAWLSNKIILGDEKACPSLAPGISVRLARSQPKCVMEKGEKETSNIYGHKRVQRKEGMDELLVGFLFPVLYFHPPPGRGRRISMSRQSAKNGKRRPETDLKMKCGNK